MLKCISFLKVVIKLKSKAIVFHFCSTSSTNAIVFANRFPKLLFPPCPDLHILFIQPVKPLIMIHFTAMHTSERSVLVVYT